MILADPEYSVEIQERLDNFHRDLPVLDSKSIVKKHVIFGECFLLNSGDSYSLKEIIAKKFSIHESEIVMVGSAQMGFSIAPRKLYLPFRDTSDIDIAIVSEVLFDSVWNEV